ncbi:MAG: TIGR02302 family protein [Alphaproteobacteria bacterium]|nr:TIGR02302 family protein [Alphaproteobacteria bacterium]
MRHLLPSRLDLKIALQRTALLAEEVWNKGQKPLLAAGIAIALLASGVMEQLPSFVQLVILAILGLGFLFTLKDFFDLRSPSKLWAMRRMESYSNINHRSLSGFDDHQADETKNDESRLLWEAHQQRQLEAIETVKIAPPVSLWRKFDPLALRVPVALLAFAALLLGHGDLISNTRNALNFETGAAKPNLVLDAWLKPPSYTGKQPILLTSAAMREKLAANPDVVVPENSGLSLRMVGANAPHLAFYSPGIVASAETEIKSITPQVANNAQGFAAEVKIDRPVIVKLFDGSQEVASWPISLVPDEAPKIAFAEDPKASENGGLEVHWKASDDYGIKSVSSEISLADEQEKGIGFENNGVFIYDAPLFKIAPPKAGAKTIDTTSKQDLSAHPWAGLYVTMVLSATDGAGHMTTSEPRRFKLPERAFYRFLPRALIEQRKSLILNPDSAPDVSTMLDAFAAYPYVIRDQSRLILQLAAIKAALSRATETDEVKTIVDELWALALAIEDGQMGDLRAQLHELKQQLEQALKDGAPRDKIAELTDKLRRTMDKLLDQMQKEAQKRAAENGKQPDTNGKSVSREDLQKMLDDIEQLNKGGSKEAAQDLLSQLDQMLQNLQPGGQSQAGQPGDNGLQDKMDGLSDMMRRQQQLMDQTQKLPQPGEGQPSPDGKAPGAGNLADRQGSLSDQLDRLNKEMGENGQGELGDASKSMKGAKDALKDGSKGEALRQQGEAMKKLQEGAKKLGQKLAQQGKGQNGQKGKDGQSGSNDTDPLGRPRATHNPGDGPNKDMVPSELSMRRAREILESLRQRYDDPNLGSGEKAYIDRLLRGLY